MQETKIYNKNSKGNYQSNPIYMCIRQQWVGCVATESPQLIICLCWLQFVQPVLLKWPEIFLRTWLHSIAVVFLNKFGSSQPPTASQHGTGATSRIFCGDKVLLGSFFSPKQRHICCLSYKNQNTKWEFKLKNLIEIPKKNEIKILRWDSETKM